MCNRTVMTDMLYPYFPPLSFNRPVKWPLFFLIPASSRRPALRRRDSAFAFTCPPNSISYNCHLSTMNEFGAVWLSNSRQTHQNISDFPILPALLIPRAHVFCFFFLLFLFSFLSFLATWIPVSEDCYFVDSYLPTPIWWYVHHQKKGTGRQLWKAWDNVSL